MADPVDLDARLDDLFTASPDGFVKTREALVKELRQADRRDDADTVHALRRPTVAVWGINQMARAQPDRLGELVGAGADLDALQQRGAGASDDLRAASRTRRDLLEQLTDVAASLTERPETTRPSIAATLDAASLEPALEDDLLRGRLTAELAPPVRFLGDVAAGGDSPRPTHAARPARASKRPTPAPPRDDLAARRAATALAEARARAEAADDDMRDAEARIRDAQDTLDAAHRHVAELEAALADARGDVTDAKRRVTEATRAETSVRTAQRRAEAALRVAERHAQDAAT